MIGDMMLCYACCLTRDAIRICCHTLMLDAITFTLIAFLHADMLMPARHAVAALCHARHYYIA